MPSAKQAHCHKCGASHARPVGNKCKMSSSDVVPSSSGSSASSTERSGEFSDLLFAKLDAVCNRLDVMDQRIQKTETLVSEGRSSQTNGMSNESQVDNNCDVNDQANVVPSMGYLRSDSEIQRQVQQRVREVQSVPECSGNCRVKCSSENSGRFRSQRTPNSNVMVKKQIDWPQNFILVGPNKKHVAFDDLTCPQFVAGFLRSYQLISDCKTKENMIDYMASLMEDASDFSFESARASHAVLLSSMEADRCDWLDTEQIDRCRRANAQRHTAPSNRSNEVQISNQNSRKQSKLCKFFQRQKCFKQNSHWTNDIYYRHECTKCGENHHVSECTNKAKN